MHSSTFYCYEKYSFRVATLLMALLTFFFLFSSEYIGGSITLALGVFFAISYHGIWIDGEKQKYLKYDRFLSFKIGSWKAYSKPSYVTVVRINLSSSRNSPAPMVLPDNRKDAKSFKVNLVVEGRERFVQVCRGPKDSMIEEALKLGNYLGIRVLDFTTSEKKWIS